MGTRSQKSLREFPGAGPKHQPWQREEPGWDLPPAVVWPGGGHQPFQASSSPLDPPASPNVSSPLSVPKDEYLADLYHFVTKEDSYANYFIHVSPRPGPSHPELRG